MPVHSLRLRFGMIDELIGRINQHSGAEFESFVVRAHAKTTLSCYHFSDAFDFARFPWSFS